MDLAAGFRGRRLLAIKRIWEDIQATRDTTVRDDGPGGRVLWDLRPDQTAFARLRVSPSDQKSGQGRRKSVGKRLSAWDFFLQVCATRTIRSVPWQLFVEDGLKGLVNISLRGTDDRHVADTVKQGTDETSHPNSRFKNGRRPGGGPPYAMAEG